MLCDHFMEKGRMTAEEFLFYCKKAGIPVSLTSKSEDRSVNLGNISKTFRKLRRS